MKTFSLSFFLLLSTQFILAQEIKQARLEFSVENMKDLVFVQPIGEYGLVVIRDNIQYETSDEERALSLQIFDTDLKEKLSKVIVVSRQFVLEASYLDGKDFYLLFNDGNLYRPDLDARFVNMRNIEDANNNDGIVRQMGNVILMHLDAENMQMNQYEFNISVPFSLSNFKVKDSLAIFGGSINRKAVVVMYDIDAKRSATLPSLYKNNVFLREIITDTGNENIQVVSSEYRDNKVGLTIRSYDRFAHLNFEYEIDGKENYSLSNGKIAGKIGQDVVLAGAYSYNKSRHETHGFYLVDLSEKDPNFRFHNYGDLKNFFNYMKEGRRDKLKKKNKRKRIKGKTFKRSYRMKIQQIIEDGDVNYLLGEAYYPSFGPMEKFVGASPVSGYDGYNNVTAPEVFKGYNFTHAVIIAFTNDGKLLWDNSFELDNVRSFNFPGHIHMLKQDDQILLLYLSEQEIRTKVIEKGQDLKSATSVPLQRKYSGDKIIYSAAERNNVKHGYDNVYYATGYCRVRNKEFESGPEDRSVFFINKIVVD